MFRVGRETKYDSILVTGERTQEHRLKPMLPERGAT